MGDHHYSRYVWGVVFSTSGAIAASLLLTALVAPWFGIELSAQGFLFAFLVPAIIAPLLSIPRARANYKLRQLRDELEKLAHTDSLSGLMNRRAFFERTREIFVRAETDIRQVGLMMIDVDHFKSINDNHGHEAGDAAIRAIATTLADTVVDTTTAFPNSCECLIARFGGEEFVVLSTGLREPALMRMAEDIRANVENFVRVGQATPVATTVSVGVAMRAPGQGIDAALRAADGALYEAKRAGRNCVRAAKSPEADRHSAATLVPDNAVTSVRDRKRAADAA